MLATGTTQARAEHPATTTLPGGITATTTGRTIALTGNTFPSKTQIKDAGFRWDTTAKRWTGGAKSLSRLLAALGQDSQTPTGSKPTFPPTIQQAAILNAVATGDDVVIEALAGTGKTSTLELIAAAHPTKRILLVVFNRSMQQEASGRMPGNVECRTFDSLGFAGAPPMAVAKFKVQKDAGWNGPGAPIRKLVDVAEFLGLEENPITVTTTLTAIVNGETVTTTTEGALPPARAASLALRAVEQWCTSSDPEITPKHVREVSVEIAEAIAPVAVRAWEDITSAHGHLRITNGHLTKMWALGAPDLTQAGTGPKHTPDMILVDEAQDTAPVVEEVMRAQTPQTVWVGDGHQAIYAWRGAQDSLSNVEPDPARRLPLTQSWRFGPEIAAVGNAYLASMHSPWMMVGGGKPGRVVPKYSMDRPDAVLCRTNAGMIGEVLSLLRLGLRAAVPAGSRADMETLARTVRWLMGGPVPSRIHDDLAAYATWDELSKAVGSGDADMKVEGIHRLVTDSSIEALEECVSGLVEVGQAGAHGAVVVTTAHKAKGLQWPRVRIAADFPQPRKDRTSGHVMVPGREEQKLAYVAVTRAQSILDPGSLAWILEV